LTKKLSPIGELTSDGVGTGGTGRIGVVVGEGGVGVAGLGDDLGIVWSIVSGVVGGIVPPAGGVDWADATPGTLIKVSSRNNLEKGNFALIRVSFLPKSIFFTFLKLTINAQVFSLKYSLNYHGYS